MRRYTVIVANNSGSVFLVHVEAGTPQAAMILAAEGRGEAFFVFAGHVQPLDL